MKFLVLTGVIEFSTTKPFALVFQILKESIVKRLDISCNESYQITKAVNL